MTKYEINSKYMIKNGKPWFPVMGEFHYSRYPRKYWKESLYKMKSAGVDIVSSYIIWIHHEEEEGIYDFSDNKDIREFIKCVDECGMKFFLRVGPWCHAEVRYGGFPKWFMDKQLPVRTNDEKYLYEIRKFWSKIYEQIEGLFYNDGGPIIGIQIENEYGHAGAQSGKEEGIKHMKILKDMLNEIGYDVPLYTATGWGGAIIGDCIPVMGGYCEAPWERTNKELPPNANYTITYERDDHQIGKGLAIGEGATYDYKDYPFLTAELGAGLQVTYDRRPVATANDIGAVTLTKLASGVNLLGYYMFHGGTNPDGRLSRLNETKETGGWCELAEFNYDFRAPIRAYGQISDTYRELKLFLMFIKDFGDEFATMTTYIPNTTPDTPDNLEDLRISIRHNQKSGYIFVNNYQRRYDMAEHKNYVLEAELENETIRFPAVDIKNKDYFFCPFNFRIGKAVIKSTLASPLCKLQTNGFADTYIFYIECEDESETEYDIEGQLGNIKLLTISRKDALNAWKITLDREYLIICDGAIIKTDNGYEHIYSGKDSLKIYPELSEKAYNSIMKSSTSISNYVKSGIEGQFTVYELSNHEQK
ncbi:MAG: beta-galactosidase, partial [Eubacterium sp.]